MAYRLALHLGYANPDAMRANMPWRVWQGWITYAKEEPFGEERADLRIAQLAALMANAWLRNKGQRRFRISDFMFDFDTSRTHKAPDALVEKVFTLNKAFGGTFIDKREETG